MSATVSASVRDGEGLGRLLALGSQFKGFYAGR
jgi:hypothetical protein